MYIIKFAANIDGLGGDELGEKLDNFNSSNEILLNQKVKAEYREDNIRFTCQTEERLLSRLLVQICERFEIDNMVLSNLNQNYYDD